MRAQPFLLSAVLLTTGVGANEQQALDPKTKKLVEQIAAAPNAEVAGRGCVELFRKPDRKMLAQLKQVKQTGVALRAAWEEALLLGADKELFGKPRTLDNKPPQTVRPEAMQRFLGFVEGKLQVQLPGWWEQTVKGHHRDEILLEKPKAKVSQQASWSKAGLRVGNESVRVAPAIAKKHRWRNVAVLSNDKARFVALHSSVGHPHPLLCLNRDSGKLIWETTVWDWGLPLDTMVKGVWFENVSLVQQAEHLFVFGAGYYWFYIEAFDARTGKNLFRFANEYADEHRNGRKAEPKDEGSVKALIKQLGDQRYQVRELATKR